jgi:flagellar hook assembly protein FlgD
VHQNYPNPFNPSTQISFELPEPANVSLVVYDVLGRKVIELVNKTYEVGYHSVTWNASNASTGVYFARFVATDASGNLKLSKVKKLLLTK